jgi:F-type H+-transporting ATPase subunit epsilon
LSEHGLIEAEIVTPDGRLYTEVADLVVVPGVEGELGIMAQHQALVTLLAVGETCLRNSKGEYLRYATGIGYAEVLFDKVRVVVDTAERCDEIDVTRAEEALHRAEERLARRDDAAARAELDFHRAEMALRRAANRIRVAQKDGGKAT